MEENNDTKNNNSGGAKKPLNLPNRLTIMRVCLIPVFIALFFIEFEWHMLASMIVFCVASVTDYFDGRIARSKNLVTNLGKFLDPIADKMLVSSALIALCVIDPIVNAAGAFKIMTTVFAMIIIMREIMISGFRIVAADKGLVLAADMTGKIKTLLQMLAIIFMLPVNEYFVVNPHAAGVVYYFGFSLLALATLMTLVSCIRYLIKNRSVLED